MQDVFHALFEFIVHSSIEGIFSESRSRLGCALSIAALGVFALSVGVFVAAICSRKQEVADLLTGLSCLGGLAAFMLGLIALIVKARETRL
jgi:hypothetical protein